MLLSLFQAHAVAHWHRCFWVDATNSWGFLEGYESVPGVPLLGASVVGVLSGEVVLTTKIHFVWRRLSLWAMLSLPREALFRFSPHSVDADESWCSMLCRSALPSSAGSLFWGRVDFWLGSGLLTRLFLADTLLEGLGALSMFCCAELLVPVELCGEGPMLFLGILGLCTGFGAAASYFVH